MAKTGFWLSGARGKLAGAAMQKTAYGSTMMRQVVIPKNPRTAAQLFTRIIMSTVSKAYKQLQEICDHSFEGVPYGAQSMSHFSSVNNRLIRARFNAAMAEDYDTALALTDFNLKGSYNFALNQYRISEGSIPSLSYSIADGKLVLPCGGQTWADLKSLYGLQDGDQLTFIYVSAATLGTPHIARTLVSKGNILNDGKVGDTNIAAAFSGNNLQIADGVMAAAIIISRKNGTEWLRSTENLLVSEAFDGGVTLAQALASYKSETVAVPSPWYLNNADVNLGGDSPAPTPAINPFIRTVNSPSSSVSVTKLNDFAYAVDLHALSFPANESVGLEFTTRVDSSLIEMEEDQKFGGIEAVLNGSQIDVSIQSDQTTHALYHLTYKDSTPVDIFIEYNW